MIAFSTPNISRLKIGFAPKNVISTPNILHLPALLNIFWIETAPFNGTCTIYITLKFCFFSQQIEYLNKTYDTDVPLVLMNSFNTDEETEKVIKKYSGFRVRILTFNQSCYPRLNKESLLPIARDVHVERDLEA